MIVLIPFNCYIREFLLIEIGLDAEYLCDVTEFIDYFSVLVQHLLLEIQAKASTRLPIVLRFPGIQK